jgi:hypothetical protein
MFPVENMQMQICTQPFVFLEILFLLINKKVFNKVQKP